MHLGTWKNPLANLRIGLGCPYRGTDETSSYTTKKPHRLGGGNLSWDDGMADEGIFDRFFGERYKGKKPKDLEFFEKTRLGCFFWGGGCIFDFFWGGDESLWNISTQESRTRCFFPSCGIVESSDDSSLQRKTGKWCSLQSIPLCCFWSKDYFAPPFLKPQNWWNKQTNHVGSSVQPDFFPWDSLQKAHPKNSTKNVNTFETQSRRQYDTNWGFPKMVVPNNHWFSCKKWSFWGGLGVPPFKETPNSNNALFLGDIP